MSEFLGMGLDRMMQLRKALRISIKYTYIHSAERIMLESHLDDLDDYIDYKIGKGRDLSEF